jgi:uncharacterized membrane protein
MEDATTPRPKRRFLLILSLCLNLFLLGVIAAGLFAAWQREALGVGGGLASSPFHPRNIAAMLPPDGKDKVQAIIRENRAKFMPLIRNVRRSRFEAFRVLQEEPPDRAKLSAAMDDVRRADAELAAEGQKVLIQIMEKLTPEERKIVIEKVRSRSWVKDVERALGEDSSSPN